MIKNKNEKKLNDVKMSAGLFSFSAILFAISWVLSGFDGWIWLFLALINFTSAITLWSTYQTEKKKLEKEREEDNEEERDK